MARVISFADNCSQNSSTPFSVNPVLIYGTLEKKCKPILHIHICTISYECNTLLHSFFERKKMKDIDFKECKFINDELRFLSFFDFCDNRKIIKFFYNILTSDGKIFYRWYVYANIHMDERYKNTCWDYINGYIDDVELLYQKRFYKMK